MAYYIYNKGDVFVWRKSRWLILEIVLCWLIYDFYLLHITWLNCHPLWNLNDELVQTLVDIFFFSFLLKRICFHISNCLFFHILTYYLILNFFELNIKYQNIWFFFLNAKSNILVFFLLFNT